MFNLSGDTVFKKGFMLSVFSSENDYDHLKTKSKHFETLEEAKTFIECVEIYASVFGNHYGRGDKLRETFDLSVFRENHLKLIFYYADDPEYYIDIFKNWSEKSVNEVVDAKDYLFDSLSEMCYEIMDGSEDYVCRVLEQYAIHEIKEDITFAIAA